MAEYYGIDDRLFDSTIKELIQEWLDKEEEEVE